MFKIAEQALTMVVEGLGEPLEMAAKSPSPADPALDENLGIVGGQAPKGTEILLEQIGLILRGVDFHERQEAFEPFFADLFQALQEQVAASLDEDSVFLAALTDQIAPGLVDSLIDQSHDMVRVKDLVDGISEDLLDRTSIGAAEVGGDSLELAGLFQLMKKGDDGIGVLAFLNVKNLTGFQVHHDTDIMMALAN